MKAVKPILAFAATLILFPALVYLTTIVLALVRHYK